MKYMFLLGVVGVLFIGGAAATVGLPLPIDERRDSPCPGAASLYGRAYLGLKGPWAEIALTTENDEALRACLHAVANKRDNHPKIRNIRVTWATFKHPGQIHLRGRATFYQNKHLRRTTKLQDGRISWNIDKAGLVLKTYADLDIWGELYDKHDRKRYPHARLSQKIDCWGRLERLRVSEDERSLLASVKLWPVAGC